MAGLLEGLANPAAHPSIRLAHSPLHFPQQEKRRDHDRYGTGLCPGLRSTPEGPALRGGRKGQSGPDRQY